MILKKIYTEPQTFEPVEFVLGMNFIYGKKKSTDSKKSLNSIGKSTFLDLLDFALLSNFNVSSKRLYAAYEKGILKNTYVILEFEINEIDYTIKRSFEEPNNNILFSINNSEFIPYQIIDLKIKLCDLFFKRDNYLGIYSNSWFRNLMLFFIKIQKHKKDSFTDPVKYIKELNEAELNQYHLFLMNFDNSLSCKNYEFQTNLKNIKPALKGITELFNEKYNLPVSERQLPSINSKLRNLQIEVEKLDETIKSFELQSNYKVNEIEANQLTSEIKRLWFENYSDKKRIESYQASFHADDVNIQTTKVSNIYKEFNILLGERVKKTLDEVIDFKQNLVKSRKNFISKEIKIFNEKISNRDLQISILEEKRKKIFQFLENENAISDLSEAHYNLTEKRKELSELKSKVEVYEDLKKEETEIETEIKKLEIQILEFKKRIQNSEYEFAKIIQEIYNSIYPEFKGVSIFDISPAPEKQSKLAISFLNDSTMFGKGKNNGRTIIYDLAILLNAKKLNLPFPYFIVHDGIFDGMDKAHFISLYQFIQNNKKNIQYIVTYNQEGILGLEFGNPEIITNEKIEEEAILVLTPEKKLLGEF
jgi:uncharacterized protein YydD (DUF2326 family)